MQRVAETAQRPSILSPSAFATSTQDLGDHRPDAARFVDFKVIRRNGSVVGFEPGKIADVDDDRFHAESRLVKTAVREFTVKGHLAAFEAGTDAAAGTGSLALAAATATEIDATTS
jgi:hypothetical protein